MTHATLERIETIVERACQDAIKHAPLYTEAVNWADLHCTDVGVAEVNALRDGHGYYAIVEEASPSAVGLQAFIIERLHDNGFDNVEVRTEW